MTDPRFPILGADTPVMLGRARAMRRSWNELTKQSPSHLSVVGPRYSGKSVLLKSLAERMRQEDSPYKAVILWDLGHRTPASDEAFLAAMCQCVGQAIKPINSDYGDHLLSVDSNEYGELREVMEALNEERGRVLMLWDGFDKPLGSGKLTRNLWDQLRELASCPSLRLVTATRRTLHELIRSEESVSSDFWNIFDMNPVRLGAFDEGDREEIFSRIPRIELDAGGKTELENWTAGYPPLYLAVVNQVIELGQAGSASNQLVNEAARKAQDGVGGILDDLWNDCPETARELYRHLVEHGEVSASKFGKAERAHLTEKGFARSSGNKLFKACRLLERHVRNLGEDAGSMVRLFGTWEEYRGNIRGLLHLRLCQLKSLDGTLRRYIERSIQDIPEHPEVCLVNMRGIADRALSLIWGAEFGAGRNIPADWIDYWERTLPRKQDGSSPDLKGIFPEDKVPSSPGFQCRLLQLVTGAEKNIERKARFVSKSTYVLVESIKRFGDFGQHLDDVEVHEGTGIAAIVSAIELAACLNRELPQDSRG